jgi:hypothetical protein
MSLAVTYRTTKWNLIAFNLREIGRRWTIRVALVLFGIYHFGVLVPHYFAMPGSTLRHIAAASLFTLGLVVVVSIAVLASLWFMFSTSQNAGVLTEHRLTISEDGITEVTPVNRTEHSWAGVPLIERNSRYIYIYTQQYGAHVIPVNAFSSPQTATEFFVEAQRLWRAFQ